MRGFVGFFGEVGEVRQVTNIFRSKLITLLSNFQLKSQRKEKMNKPMVWIGNRMGPININCVFRSC